MFQEFRGHHPPAEGQHWHGRPHSARGDQELRAALRELRACFHCLRLRLVHADARQRVAQGVYQLKYSVNRRTLYFVVQACRKRPHLRYIDYADTARAVFLDAGGIWAKGSNGIGKLVNVFLCLSQIGSNAVYVLFIAQNIQPVSLFERKWNTRVLMNWYDWPMLRFLFPVALCPLSQCVYLLPACNHDRQRHQRSRLPGLQFSQLS